MVYMKKIWEKPKLIILLRGRPEEMVLASCKYTKLKNGPANKNTQCITKSGKNCVVCSTAGTS